jgi:hypothetical protein
MQVNPRLRRALPGVLVSIAALSIAPSPSLAAKARMARDASPTSIWNTAPARDAQLDPRSGTLVSGLVTTVQQGIRAGRSPWIDTNNCAPPVYTVPVGTPTSPVALLNGTRPFRVTLASALAAVPIPDGALPSRCSDSTLIIKQPATNRMWELWHAHETTTGWSADYGGATQRLAASPGFFDANDWPGAPDGWGASASGLTVAGGLLTLDEVRKGVIDHAMALSIPESASGLWASPARRTDGVSKRPNALPYGARLRLDPTLDVDSLKVPRATKMIARAAQRYGFVVREQTHWGVQIAAERAPLDQSSAYQAAFRSSPGTIMRAFPWKKLQVLRMDLHRAGS